MVSPNILRNALATVCAMAALCSLAAGAGPPPPKGNVSIIVTGAPVAVAKPTQATEAGRAAFASRCAMCHGAAGQGNGPAALGLLPKPRMLSDAFWQNAISDDDLSKVIKLGGRAIGKSPTMPPQADLESQPALLNALVTFVRSLRAPHGTIRVEVMPIVGGRVYEGRAELDASGGATVLVRGVPAGAYTVTASSSAGPSAHCKVPADVVPPATRVVCAPAKGSAP